MTRTLTALLATVALTAGLGGAFAAGTTIGSDDERPSPGTGGRGGRSGDAVSAAYAGTDVATAASCPDLLDSYVERGVDLVGPWGWDGGPAYGMEGDVASDSGVAGSASLPAAGAPSTVRQTNEATGTTVQEAGVDEPDAVKTDATTLFRVDDGDLTAYDVSGAEVVRVGSVDLPGLADAEILLVGSTVVAVGEDPDGEQTRVATIDVTAPAAPTVRHTWVYDTALVTARLHDGTVRLVLQAGLPDLGFTRPDDGHWFFGTDADDATRANQQAVRDSTLDDWLPHVSLDGAVPEPLLGCDQVGLPDDDGGLGTIAIVGLDPQAAQNPAGTSVTGLAVATDITYASADRLYLATSAASATAGWSECLDCPVRPTSTSSEATSQLYSFALTGRATTYVASGTVDGTVRDRWSLDEADGVLRVAVGRSSATDDTNAVVTMAEEGDDLVESGRLGGLGRGEDIQSVRWFDGVAIVVTFRRTDPLYAVDLTDTAQPALLGELEIPGFSSYLHPLGADRMIGVGEGPDGPSGRRWGAQLGLFDVTDLSAPRRIGLTHYGPDTYAAAATDPRQLTWLPERRTVLTVVGDYTSGTGWVSVVHLDHGAMSNEMVEVEHGDEVADVRLVPLPDERVVLVTGDDASFLDLA